MKAHSFGGDWTEAKLATLREYLTAYRIIFTGNEKARWFRTLYIDAFAGTGYRNDPSDVYDELDDNEEVTGFRDGSARIALQLDSPFDEYIFIEKSAEHSSQLHSLKYEFPEMARAITIMREDANDALIRLCRERNWHKERAVAFLDPYGMQVNWSIIEAIAATEAIDMWLLFPLGMGVNRLLTRRGPPPEAFKRRLDLIFGEPDWEKEFYQRTSQVGLFDGEPQYQKIATFEAIKNYFLGRLRTVFVGVSDNVLLLLNSKNVPIYMLCFAAGNPKGMSPAIRIANDLILMRKAR